MKEASRRKINVLLHLHEAPREVKFIGTERRWLPGARGRVKWELLSNAYTIVL